MERLETLILDRGLIERTRDLKIVYTPIHGTGGVIVKPMLRKIGLNFSVVPEQDQFDGRFPTVKSPNPENAEALNLGISLAQKQNADLVVATDPDCDRMGVAVRTSSGEMKLLSGNQIGSLLAWYRAMIQRPTHTRWKPIDKPVQVIWGEKDRYLLREIAEPEREWVPDLRFAPIPEASHWVHADAPDRVNALLLDFLRNRDR